MSSHRALQSQDIVNLIFDEFDGTKSRDRRTCINASTVCRTFADPASRVVWSTVPILTPLWHVLEGHPGATSPPKEATVRNILQTKPYKNKETWYYFLHCAARITVIGFQDSFWYTSEDEASLIRAIYAHNGDSPFLTSLRILRWTLSPTIAGLLPLFSIPLRLAEIHFFNAVYAYQSPSSPSGDVLEQHIPSLIAWVPSLRTLTLRSVDVEAPAASMISLALGLHNLQHLGIYGETTPSMTPSLVRRLNAMKRLQRLRIEVQGFVSYQKPVDLPHLMSLSCSGTPRNLLGLAANLVAPQLEDVTFVFGEDGTLDDCDSCVVSLTNSLGASLRWLSLRCMRGILPRRPGPFPHMLRLGARLPLLERWTIDFSDRDTGRDELYENPWNNQRLQPYIRQLPTTLRHFTLCFRVPLEGTSKTLHNITATILEDFARACPNLISLHLDWLDGTHNGMLPLPPVRPPLNHPLKVLCCSSYNAHRHAVDAAAMARFVHSIFPNLDVGMCSRSPHSPPEGWDSVVGALKDIKGQMVDSRV